MSITHTKVVQEYGMTAEEHIKLVEVGNEFVHQLTDVLSAALKKMPAQLEEVTVAILTGTLGMISNGRLGIGLVAVAGAGTAVSFNFGQWQEGVLWLAVAIGVVLLDRELKS